MIFSPLDHISIRRNRKLGAYLVVLTASQLTSACSGNSNDTPASTERFGIFLDSAVKGLQYTTPSRTGITDDAGTFSYLPDEGITFAIGELSLPEIMAVPVVTPLDIFGATSSREQPVVNLARLLQSLDTDGNPDNGIVIDPTAADSSSPVDFTSSTFDQQVVNLVANSGSVNTTLIDSATATAHLESTLEQHALPGGGCTRIHPLVGEQQEFQTYFHGVSGTVLIVDDCTIKITGFNYDGQGPQVYFYGALDAQYGGADAFIIGEQLNGTEFVNEQITLALPVGRTLDEFNGISVWCAEFRVDFGSAEFELTAD